LRYPALSPRKIPRDQRKTPGNRPHAPRNGCARADGRHHEAARRALLAATGGCPPGDGVAAVRGRVGVLARANVPDAVPGTLALAPRPWRAGGAHADELHLRDQRHAAVGSVHAVLRLAAPDHGAVRALPERVRRPEALD